MSSATITFSQVGVQPPVYVVTSLSEPPWQPVEMKVVQEETTSPDLTFSLHFENVPEGDHQYKIRIGDGHWVVDESKDSATDEHGNRNNVVHVKPAGQSKSVGLQPDEKPTDPPARRKDSTIDEVLPNTTIPFVVVEKVADKEQPEYGDTEPHLLNMNAAKRTADAKPDLEMTYKETPVDTDHVSPGAELDRAAPLFRHESAKADEPSTTSIDAIDEAESSADQTSSSDALNTPSEPDEEADLELLLPHEMGPVGKDSGGLNSYNGRFDDSDELDATPLLPHETGFSRYAGSESTTDSDSSQRFRTRTLEPDEAPTFTHEEDDSDGYQDDDSPLLPHERTHGSADSENISPEEEAHFMLDKQPTFDYENGGHAEKLFGGPGRPNIFKSRSNSSTLPHNLPRSDAEDENLQDPLLERFPTHREQILQRVATIGLHLPEDHVIEENVHSPVMSVLSQACSSVDLAPVKSYTSLASVPEADDSDEDDYDEMESLPSPMVLNMGCAAKDFAKDPHATPMPKDFKPVESAEATQTSAHVGSPLSDAASVSRNDGAKDVSSTFSPPLTPENKHDGSKDVFKTINPPLTPETKAISSSDQSAIIVPESQLRQRQVPKNDASTDSPAPSATQTMTSSPAQPIDQPNETFLQNFVRIVFGPIGRFFAACLGDRKRAGDAGTYGPVFLLGGVTGTSLIRHPSAMVFAVIAAAYYVLASA